MERRFSTSIGSNTSSLKYRHAFQSLISLNIIDQFIAIYALPLF